MMKPFTQSIPLLLATALASGLGSALASEDSGTLFFESKIRPLLIEHCYECHSTDGEVKAGLKLDSRNGWVSGGDSGPAIVPGEPNRSLLIRAVRGTDPDFQMPPDNPLTAAEVEALEQWVRMGAPDPRDDSASSIPLPDPDMDHWAYQPIQTSKPPQPQNEDWVQTEIDRFILARLEDAGLAPAPTAARATLVRRAYFDLTGLPPTPEQIENFLGDDSREAFARLVDQLLNSPAFGEHWARHWLDVVRFGESVTLRGLVFPNAWRYRDYVIESFNRDVPINRFIKEQIAGDLLPADDWRQQQRQLTALAFLAVGNWNLEDQDKRKLEMDVVDEQIDTIGKTFLGQTIGCARCHNHKFDPIPTRDYYAMAGILDNVSILKHANVSGWVERPLPVAPELEQRLADYQEQETQLKNELQKAKDALAEITEDKRTADSIPPETLPGIVIDSDQATRVGQWKNSQYNQPFIGTGYLHDLAEGKGDKSLTFTPELAEPGRYEVRLAYQASGNRARNVPITVYHAAGETVVHVNQQQTPPIEKLFISLGTFDFAANGSDRVTITNEGTDNHVMADAVQFLNTSTSPALVNTSPDQDPAIRDKIAALKEQAAQLEVRLKELQKNAPERPMAMGLQERAEIAEPVILLRGNVHSPGPTVPRGFLSALPHDAASKIPENQSGRLQLAEWIAHPDNPLTARVFVNRVWLWLMGEGIVRTPDNFGTTGQIPSHPELLDYLASQFASEGWSLKSLIRQIMLSHTYQLSATATGPAYQAHQTLDPQNLFWWRAHQKRLTAEAIRDTMLFVSGDLNLAMGGRTFPESRKSDFGFSYDGTRRSIYVPVFRNALPEVFEAFDFPPSGLVTGKRDVSTVATQALYLLNDPFVHDQAEKAAARLLQEVAPDQRLTHLYLATLGRLPSAEEQRLAQNHLAGKPESARAWGELVHALFASLDFRYLK